MSTLPFGAFFKCLKVLKSASGISDAVLRWSRAIKFLKGNEERMRKGNEERKRKMKQTKVVGSTRQPH
jgi:hypothetical protein